MANKPGKKRTTEGDEPWRISCYIRDPDFARQIKYRLVDDDLKIEELVLAGVRLYMSTPPKRPPVRHFEETQTGTQE